MRTGERTSGIGRERGIQVGTCACSSVEEQAGGGLEAPRARVAQAVIPPAATFLAGAGTCLFVGLADPTTPGGITPPCPTKALTGVICPGCGSARMIYSLLHWDIRSALAYNAVGVIAVVLLIWSYIAWVSRRVFGRHIARWDTWRWAPMIAGIVVVVWFVIRNLPFAPFDALRV